MYFYDDTGQFQASASWYKTYQDFVNLLRLLSLRNSVISLRSHCANTRKNITRRTDPITRHCKIDSVTLRVGTVLSLATDIKLSLSDDRGVSVSVYRPNLSYGLKANTRTKCQLRRDEIVEASRSAVVYSRPKTKSIIKMKLLIPLYLLCSWWPRPSGHESSSDCVLIVLTRDKSVRRTEKGAGLGPTRDSSGKTRSRSQQHVERTFSFSPRAGHRPDAGSDGDAIDSHATASFARFAGETITACTGRVL